MNDDMPSLHDLAMKRAQSGHLTPEQQYKRHEQEKLQLQRDIIDKFLKDVGAFAKREAQKLEKAKIPKLELQVSGHDIHGWHIAYVNSDGEVHKWLQCGDGNLTNFLTYDGRMMFVLTGYDGGGIGAGTLHTIRGSSDFVILCGADISTFDQHQAYTAFVAADDGSYQWLWGSRSSSAGHISFYDDPKVIIRGWEAAVEDMLKGNPLIGECEICDAKLIEMRRHEAAIEHDHAIRQLCRQFYRWAKAYDIQPNVGRLTGSVFRRTVGIGWLLDYSVTSDYNDPHGAHSYSYGENKRGMVLSVKGKLLNGYSRTERIKIERSRGEQWGYFYFAELNPLQDDVLIGDGLRIEDVKDKIAGFASIANVPLPKFAEKSD